ncbi:MAG TPA: Mur ligase family protein, partial [Rhodothermales bacterium]|nr:Mur ligase family protein [Rhodothermales bacterium]
MLFPRGTPSRIPIAAITGTNGKTTTTRMVAHILKMVGFTPGMTSTDGVFVDGRLTVRGDMTGPSGARMVLRDPTVDAAILEVARGGLVRAGLGFRVCDVAAVLNVTEDHLGLGGIDTLDQLAAVKRIPVEVARDTAVLNADDARVLAMAKHTSATHVCLVTMRPNNDAVRRHVRDGGRAVVLERGLAGDMITIYDGGRHIPLIWTHLIPATIDGKAWHNVQNAMFAAALTYAMGEGVLRGGEREVGLEAIRHGLRTFTTSFYEAPGRLNVFDEHPFRVILDYAHNPAAVQAMVDLVNRLDVEGRRCLVVSAPGDRRDEDIRAIAHVVAGHFDHYVCRRDDHARGRGPDEIPRMLRDALVESGVNPEDVVVLPNEIEATTHALTHAGPGDLLVLLADQVSRTWEQVVHFNEGARHARRTEGGDGAPPPAGDGTVPAAVVTVPPHGDDAMVSAPAPAYAAPMALAAVDERPRVRVVHARPDPLSPNDEEAD